MSRDKHDDNCSGCLPVILRGDDGRTGKPLPNDHPFIVEAVRVFREEISLEQRECWHRFTCQNSREPADVQAAQEFTTKMQAAQEFTTKMQAAQEFTTKMQAALEKID